jgi:hypothetical protein
MKAWKTKTMSVLLVEGTMLVDEDAIVTSDNWQFNTFIYSVSMRGLRFVMPLIALPKKCSSNHHVINSSSGYSSSFTWHTIG